MLTLPPMTRMTPMQAQPMPEGGGASWRSPSPEPVSGPDATLDWLCREAPRLPTIAEVLEGLSLRLLAEGLPIVRTWHGTLPVHPLVFARGWSWERGQKGAEDVISQEGRSVPLEHSSPQHRVRDADTRLRLRLDTPAAPAYPQLARLYEAGATDYVVYGLHGGRVRASLSFTTDAPGGFTEAHLARLERVRSYAGVTLQCFHLEDLAATLLGTYLGAGPGARVLNGQVHRGDGETVRAATWFCDLRGFTSASESLPMAELLLRLNDWFEAMVGAVEAHGGEVLKFMGDGMLATFTGPDARLACSAAFKAAKDGEARIATLNKRHDRRGRPIEFGLALHYGDVMYGNIGAPARLDFTVIGPVVNRAARLQALTASVGRTIVVSDTFAALCDVPMVSLGLHTLKGLPEPLEVYTPAFD
ncbi:MAG: adenylate/guanylate cyclase domain-containing protein [Pseudomonadota bacterium]|nr:adenylate/guanylate cyclase domain-containing protein [Pseudomonadota bacterium]